MHYSSILGALCILAVAVPANRAYPLNAHIVVSGTIDVDGEGLIKINTEQSSFSIEDNSQLGSIDPISPDGGDQPSTSTVDDALYVEEAISVEPATPTPDSESVASAHAAFAALLSEQNAATRTTSSSAPISTESPSSSDTTTTTIEPASSSISQSSTTTVSMPAAQSEVKYQGGSDTGSSFFKSLADSAYETATSESTRYIAAGAGGGCAVTSGAFLLFFWRRKRQAALSAAPLAGSQVSRSLYA